MNHLRSLTVKDLRQLIFDMSNIKMPTSYRKPMLVEAAQELIDNAHAEALAMNAEKNEPTYTIGGVTFTGKNAQFLIRHDAHLSRYNPTLRMNKKGIVALTPRQRRRLDKKNRAYAAKIGL